MSACMASPQVLTEAREGVLNYKGLGLGVMGKTPASSCTNSIEVTHFVFCWFPRDESSLCRVHRVEQGNCRFTSLYSVQLIVQPIALV